MDLISKMINKAVFAIFAVTIFLISRFIAIDSSTGRSSNREPPWII
jgi:hypothetical protein